MVVLRDEIWLRADVRFQIVVGTWGDRRYSEWLVVQNTQSMFKVFDIAGHGIRWESTDFMANIVGNFKCVYIRVIPLHSDIFICCMAMPVRLVALVEDVLLL